MIVCEITRYKSAPSAELRAEHLKFLRERGAKGEVLMAGRFADARGGMILWKVGSMAEAEKIAVEDPYVRGRALTYELREWSATFDYTVDPPSVPA